MSFLEYLRVALRALRAHRFRSGLTVTSITLGAFSIVLMSSLAKSGLTTLARDIEELGGARIILIAPKRPERVPNPDDAKPGELTRRDREILFDALPHTSATTVYAALGRKNAENSLGTEIRTDLVAADPGFFAALNLRLGEGRLYSEAEELRHARVCVVADEVAKKLFDGAAVGRWLTIDGDRCLVIGQLARIDHWDSNFGFEWLDFVAMPLESAAETRPEVREESLIQIRTDHVGSNDLVKRIANAILVDRHQGVDDFQIWDFNAFMAQFATMLLVMEAIVGLIAGIALLVGGIGVMNMMLVSVSERTREIGVRKAIGASPRAIGLQFLSEATVLSGIGGLLGVTLGSITTMAANYGIQQLQPLWIGGVSLPAVIIATLVTFAIGVTFGFLPARRASALDPVEAMRR